MQKEMMDKMPEKGMDMPEKGAQSGVAGKKGLPPEQQQQFDTVSRQALEYLLDEGHAKLIIDKAKQGDPKAAIVEAIQPVLQGIWAAAESAGAKLDMATFLAAGLNVITILADMMAVAGVIPEQQVAQLAQEAAQEAVNQHNAGVQPQEQPQGLAGMAQGGM